MPAEWEPHEATWIAWPHENRLAGQVRADPLGVRRDRPPAGAGEIVRILVESKAHEAGARRILTRNRTDLARVVFHRFPTDRGWTRDSGPAFVRAPGERAAAGGRPLRLQRLGQVLDFRKDRKLSRLGSPEADGLRCFLPASCSRAGSIDVNGRGTLVTTEECLLDGKVQVRNPGLTRSGYEKIFRDFLGVQNVLWLSRGIAGDDTHGHVDDLCRFVSPTTLALCHEDDPKDENYAALEENRERLEGARLEDGSKVAVVKLPMPSPLYLDGRRLPASYANFYVANAAVLVPTFNDPKDRIALGILSELFHASGRRASTPSTSSGASARSTA